METARDSDNEVLISAIEHYSYCPRQYALIHVEKVYDENVFTLKGSMAHERADEPVGIQERGVRVEKALPLWSERYGLQGKADVVEFRGDGSVCPVEYKHGGKRVKAHDDLQLCAQAICLEEMLDTKVTHGAVYHSSSHQRREVEFTEELRRKTLEVVESIREVHMSGKMPHPVDDSRCPSCSLIHVCLPSGVSRLGSVDENDLFTPNDAEVVD